VRREIQPNRRGETFMALTEEQAARIVLIRSIEECDKSVFSDRLLAEALAAARNETPGLDWIEKRAAFLFERLSAWHLSMIQLAKVPANWTVPGCMLALIVGFATNLLGSSDKIHVIRNPAVILVGWNLLVYLGLVLWLLLRRRGRPPFVFTRSGARSAREDRAGETDSSGLREPIEVPWPARYALPRLWQFVHKIMFGFQQTRNLAQLTSCFTTHWYAVAGALVAGRWRYLLHLGALSIAAGAVIGMYFRGLFQGYAFVWASAFVTEERTVSRFVDIVFGPSLWVSRLLNLGLETQIDVARLMSSQGDRSAAWIHLLALTVVLFVVVPRGLLALSQFRSIRTLVRGFPLALDRYYGEVIEEPIRSILEQEIHAAIDEFAKSVAAYVGQALYAERIVPKLREFRERGGRIADLKAELTRLTEAFSPQVNKYITDRAIPEFQRFLSHQVGEIVKSFGTDFINTRDPEAMLHDLKISPPGGAELGMSDQLSRAIGVSVGAAISLAFATVGGGIGQELGIAVIAAVLGTTGPVGFVVGLILGAVVAAGAWWFGKEKITEAVDKIHLPSTVVRTALWESRFNQLIGDGREKCEESVRAKTAERLNPMRVKIADEIMFRIRSLWGA
jgi:hypothetical protein